MSESPTRKRWHGLSFWTDVLQAIIALLAAVVLALDSTGLIAWPWLQSNLPELTFAAICLLIVVTAVERAATLRSFEEKVERRLSNIENQSKRLNETVAGSVSRDIVLVTRAEYISLVRLLDDVKDVAFTGKTLIGIIQYHHGLFKKSAKNGCKFKFLIQSRSDGNEKYAEDIRRSLNLLTDLQSACPEQIEIRQTHEILHYSLMMLDSNTPQGSIQVEFYMHYLPTSDRLHMTLSAARDPKVYQYFQDQFKVLWNEAASSASTAPGELVDR